MASTFGDITANLESLSFDAGLNEDERNFAFVRKRSHAVRTCMIGQVCYLIAIINEGKRLIYEHEKNGTEAQEIPWKEVPKRRPLKIGILGCGALGRSLVRNLQRFSDVHPEEILISTRRPELLTEFTEIGIQCFFDNKKLVKTTDLTFICCLPSQLEEVIGEIENNVRCLLYSFVAAFPRLKICNRLRFYDVIKPEFILASQEATSNSNWEYQQSISQALENPSLCEMTFPGCEQGIVTTPCKLLELIFHVFLNMCIVQGIPQQEILRMVKTVIFGNGNEDEIQMLTENDVWSEASKSTLVSIKVKDKEYKIFSLDKLHTISTEIGNILKDPQSPLGIRFRKRYVLLFDRVSSWKTKCELV